MVCACLTSRKPALLTVPDPQTGCYHHFANPVPTRYERDMISRGDILMLGIGAGVSGGLVGGLMLGLGMDLIVNGQPLGWLLLIPGAPASALIGWIMARRLARQLDQPGS
jgi:hypothetical protein